MSELTTKDITEYLKNAMELESSIYRQERAIESAKQSIKDKKGRNYNDMCNRNQNKEKRMPKKKELAKPEDSRSSRKFSPVTLAKESVRADIFYTVISIIIIILGFIFQSIYDSFHFIQKCLIFHDFFYCCVNFFVCHNSLSPFLLICVRGSSGGGLFKYLAFFLVRPSLPYPFPL